MTQAEGDPHSGQDGGWLHSVTGDAARADAALVPAADSDPRDRKEVCPERTNLHYDQG